jgi:hypothetical protein
MKQSPALMSRKGEQTINKGTNTHKVCQVVINAVKKIEDS